MTTNHHPIVKWLLALVLGAGMAIPAAGAGPVQGIDGAPYLAPKSAAVAQLRMAPDAPARTILLDAVSAVERSTANAAAARAGKHRPLRIGFVRQIDAATGTIALSALEWQQTPDGDRVAHIRLTSPDAVGLRFEIALRGDTTGIAFRFAETGGAGKVYGPFTARDIERAGHWSPVLEGDSGLVEIAAGPQADLGRSTLTISRVAHLDRAPSGKAAKDYPGNGGPAGACNIDVACVANPSQDLLHTISAVAHLSFIQDGGAYLCTGTLLNSVDANGQPTQLPYFVTANHCIPDQATASTMIMSWFFQRASCSDGATATYEQTTGGSTLLHTSVGTDVTLLRLNAAPPAGAFMSGWDASPLFPATDVLSIHHPSGNPKKFSAGTTHSYVPHIVIANDFGDPVELWPDGSPLYRSLAEVHWTEGTTEGGSSGGGLFTRAQSGQYRLRGTLWGGGASCVTPDEFDYFGRFDLSYPYLSQYLAAGTLLTGGQNAVEFYNVSLDHYFMTAYAAEVNAVESGGAGPGWTRTGYGFPVGGTLAGPNSSVCRFYGNRANGGPNSHFYTPIPAECAAVKLDPGWTFEDGSVFTMPSPTAQNNCPAGTTPVLRTYNNGFVPGEPSNSNHRYTTSQTIYSLMQALGWRAEGTVMCAKQ